MEFVLRGKKEDHDLYLEPNKDGSLRIEIRAKNETGIYPFTISADDFDLLCKIRELSIIKTREILIQKGE